MKRAKPSQRRDLPPTPPAVGVGVMDRPSGGFGPPWWLGLCALAAAFIVYLPALRGPFLFDDLALPMMNAGARMAVADYLRGVRPIYYMSFLLSYELWGTNPFPYHVVNWLLHAANSVLTFYLLRRLFALGGREGAASEWIAGFGASLFLLHPLQTESVAYIASRSELLSVFFAWAAFAIFVASNDGPSWGRVAAILGLLALALGTKEHVAAVPAVWLMVDYRLRGQNSIAGVKRDWRLYAPMAAGMAVAIPYVLAKAGGATAGFGVKGTTPLLYLWTQCQVIPRYALLFLFPAGQNLDHGVPFATSMGDPLSIAGAVALLAAVGAAWWKRAEYPLASLGVFTFLVLLAPTSSIIPIADPMAERRMYLPFLGLLLVVSEFLFRVELSKAMKAGLAAVLVLAAGLTWSRNSVYASTTAMWEDSAAGNPGNYRAQFQLAYAYYAEGRCAEANSRYVLAARLKKPEYDLLTDWALALDCANRGEEAVAKLQEALRLEDNDNAWANLGMVYGKRGQNKEAIEALDNALRVAPANDNAWVYKGNVHMALREYQTALTEYSKALSLNPANEGAQKGLAAARRALQSPQ